MHIEGARREGAPEAPPSAPEGAVLRPLPADVCRGAMAQLAQELSWPVGSWAFDGRKNSEWRLGVVGGCGMVVVCGGVSWAFAGRKKQGVEVGGWWQCE